VFKVPKIWKSDGPLLPKAMQAAAMEAFLPSRDGSLHGEVTLGSLAFSRDQYYKMRGLLIKVDASDDSHAVLDALKKLAVAPLKTLLLSRSGRESTYAKREKTWLGSTYVTLHWNASAEDAVAQMRAAAHGIISWMRRDRTAAYPYLPARKARNVAGDSDAISEKTGIELFKPKRKALDFTAEVLRGRPTMVKHFNDCSRVVQRVNEDQNPRVNRQSDQLAKLTAEIRSLKKNMNSK
jgi:hypothetical protein